MLFTGTLIAVSDIDISKKFYQELFGLTVQYDFGANIAFGGGLFLQTKRTWSEFIKTEDILFNSNSFELYFSTKDFDGFIEKLKAYKIRYVHDVEKYPWGQRAVRFYDPDGHIIEVGEDMQCVVKELHAKGLSIEEIADITQHPAAFVKECIKDL